MELGIPAALLICGGFVWMVIAARPWAERSPTRLMAWGLLGVIYLPRNERLSGYQDDTLAKLQGSWLFASQVRFAELTLTDVTPANAERMYEMAGSTVHFSPEPRVIIKLIESAQLSGHPREAQAEIERFRAAFPAEYQRWLKGVVDLIDTLSLRPGRSTMGGECVLPSVPTNA